MLISQHELREDLADGISLFKLPFHGPLGYFLNSSVLNRVLKSTSPDILNTHYASGYGTTARLAGFRPSLLSVWGSDVYEFPTKSPFHRSLLRKNLSAATRLASTSAAMARQIGSIAPQTRPVALTPFGVDLELFRPRALGRRANATLTIGTIKSLSSRYGVDVLIDAFHLLLTKVKSTDLFASRLRLRIVGDGPDRGALEARARSLGIAHLIDFVGRIDHGQVPAELAKLDIYVALSRQESFGVAVLEASASGLPVVTSDAGGLPEVVDAGRTGFIVSREDPMAAAEALGRLIFSLELRQSMGTAGRRFVEERYDWQESVAHMVSVYEDAIRADRDDVNKIDAIGMSE